LAFVHTLSIITAQWVQCNTIQYNTISEPMFTSL